MIKMSLFAVLNCIYIINIGCSANEKDFHYEKIVDSLFQEKYLARGAYKDIQSLINEIPNENKYNDLLIKFSEKYQIYRYYSLGKLARNGYEMLPMWLSKNSDMLLARDWGAVIDAITSKDNSLLNNSNLRNTIHKISHYSPDKDIRHRTRYFFVEFGTLNEILKMSTDLNTEDSRINRIDILRSLTRFQHTKLDSVLNNYILTSNNFNELQTFIELGIQEHNRYDLLPSVLKLKERLLSTKDISLKEQIDETMIVIDATLKILEQKKAENAPIGLPLNWPDEPVKK